jgi:hypothetical protein
VPGYPLPAGNAVRLTLALSAPVAVDRDQVNRGASRFGYLIRDSRTTRPDSDSCAC